MDVINHLKTTTTLWNQNDIGQAKKIILPDLTDRLDQAIKDLKKEKDYDENDPGDQASIRKYSPITLSYLSNNNMELSKANDLYWPRINNNSPLKIQLRSSNLRYNDKRRFNQEIYPQEFSNETNDGVNLYRTVDYMLIIKEPEDVEKSYSKMLLYIGLPIATSILLGLIGE